MIVTILKESQKKASSYLPIIHLKPVFALSTFRALGLKDSLQEESIMPPAITESPVITEPSVIEEPPITEEPPAPSDSEGSSSPVTADSSDLIPFHEIHIINMISEGRFGKVVLSLSLDNIYVSLQYYGKWNETEVAVKKLKTMKAEDSHVEATLLRYSSSH
jgi:hypothetical protein